MVRYRDIGDKELLMLFDFLELFLKMPYKDFKSHVSKQLIGCCCDEMEYIHWAGNVAPKCWFVTKGMVMVYVNGWNDKLIYALFKAGEIAILPDSFKNGTVSQSGLIAVMGTNLLEINTAQMEVIYRLFPQSQLLESKIISAVSAKAEIRTRLLKMPVAEREKEFHKLYPDTKGRNRKVKLLDKDKANYLNITDTYFSRF